MALDILQAIPIDYLMGMACKIVEKARIIGLFFPNASPHLHLYSLDK